MQEFKSPVSRLARLFKKGRDSWKEKALEKQKKIRALKIKVRDLSASREHWKQRSQCRYFNIERLTNWGIKLLNSSKETLIKSF